MDITIYPKKLEGTVRAIPSKSQAHRLLICAAFANEKTTLICPQTNQDIEATAACLNALGANIEKSPEGYVVTPIEEVAQTAVLPCGESGSTLRFMLPIAGALGVDATFHLEGRLPKRPMSPLWEEMERMGCKLSRLENGNIRCTGALKAGCYSIDGGVSSQFITGLLLALPLISGSSKLTVTGILQSKPYVDMTKAALNIFGVCQTEDEIVCAKPFRSPGAVQVEGDWSNGAFFLAARHLGSKLTVEGLNPDSFQGDRACAGLFEKLKDHITIDAADIPDLVPILSVVAAANCGAKFSNIARLRLKESDRVESVIAMLKALGGNAEADENTLYIFPAQLTGGTVDCAKDHRIAMSAAIAATVCSGPVTLLGAQCVEKSYPSFWEEYAKLGGKYE